MNTNIEQVRRWFFKYYDELRSKICIEFPALDFETALFRVATTLTSCKAQTERQFRQWCESQLRKLDCEKKLYEYGENLTLQDALTLAGSRPVRKGTKPMEYEVHNDRAFVKLHDSRGNVLPWRIPSDWLPIAQALWPCHVRQGRNGPYVSKKVSKQQISGKWEQRDLPVHHLFLNCDKREMVAAKNGNLLDWTGGNLVVRKPVVDDPDVEDSRTVSLSKFPDIFTLDWKPAKPTQVPRNRERPTTLPFTNGHEYRVWQWLSGRTG